ncbi:methylosome subunit pICln-like [Paramacrobiotus metropolitanus]|uniref:methylosome subunit pICln-like n=1 Tax=Paramacrobiotus metropolitanus TaxID=2943436 RepID=UPI0024465265|nr:methylosome subunit pICln-like [Paramacrobiotus metropolitanus]
MVELHEVSEPTDGIVLTQNNVAAKNRQRNFGTGRLFITEQCVCWIADPSAVGSSAGSALEGSSSLTGFTLSYYEISLHAISKDPGSFPEECIYMLLDGVEGADPATHSDMDGNDDEAMDEDADVHIETSSDVKELCFVPEDKSTLEAIFNAMSTCQALHPDAEDEQSDDEGEADDDDEAAAVEQGAGGLLNAVVHDEEFEDDEPEDGSGDAPTANGEHSLNAHHRGDGDT